MYFKLKPQFLGGGETIQFVKGFELVKYGERKNHVRKIIHQKVLQVRIDNIFFRKYFLNGCYVPNPKIVYNY